MSNRKKTGDPFPSIFSKKSLKVDKIIIVDRSGNAGTDGPSGFLTPNESIIRNNGGIGRPGWNAFHGSDAMNIDLHLAVNNGNRLLVYSKGNNTDEVEVKIYGRLALFESSSSILIKSIGGYGGRGGDGGDGIDGHPGVDGVPATQISIGTNGSSGGNGGSGGDGGNGGHGGDGGNVTINISTDDLDVLAVIESIDCSGGVGGGGGVGGSGGKGGKGGCGGASYIWTAVDKGGNSKVVTSPGGLDGRDGAMGRSGKAGLDGTAGRSGSVEYRVTEVNNSNASFTYSSLFDLSLLPLSHDQFITNTGVFEPGQVVGIRDLRLTNLSAMPSPRATSDNHHGVAIRVKRTDLIDKGSTDLVLLSKSIAYSEVYTVQRVINFKIAHIPCPAIGTSVCESTTIEFEAYATRFCRPLKGLGNLTHSITVRYPLAISIHGAKSSLFGHHLPIVIRVRNESNAAIGSRSERGPRIARVELSLVVSPVSNFEPAVPYDNTRIRFYATDSDSGAATAASSSSSSSPSSLPPPLSQGKEKVFNFSDPIIFDIHNLDAQGDLYLTGEIIVDSDSNIQCYQKLNLLASLKIGDLDYPMNVTRTRTIQVETHAFCITQPPSPLSGNDLFLVCNCETTSQDIAKWQTFASLLMLKLNVYDVSYMNGFDYVMPSYNLLEGLADRVVVILNNGFRRSDDPSYLHTAFYPLYHLSSSAIFEAARRHGVRTYIVNKQPDFEFTKLLFPSDPMEGTATSVSYRNRTSMFLQIRGQRLWPRSERLAPTYETVSIRANSLQAPSSSEEMDSRAMELQEKLSRMRPDHTYFITENTFDPEYVKPSAVWVLGRYQLGQVTVRRGLDTVNPLIAYRDATRKVIHSSVDIDFFGTLKLYPFAFKLSTMIAAITRGGSTTDTSTSSSSSGSGSQPGENNPLWSKYSSHQHLSIGAQLFCDTILSDLADEIYMIVKHKDIFQYSGIVRYYCNNNNNYHYYYFYDYS